MSFLSSHPMVICEQWEKFTEKEHQTWCLLFQRQAKLLKKRAAHEVIKGMEKLNICHEHIPRLADLNTVLEKETGFSIIPVSGLIPEDLFFQFLSERKFPSSCFIRPPHQLDYLEEPDIFHDVFGHVPLLVNPIFADFMQAFGVKGLEAIKLGMAKFAAAFYWFTVEFGLIQTKEGLKIYGAGITSSSAESVYCLDSQEPKRMKFNVHHVMATKYRTDTFQKTYFVIESFEELFESLRRLKWQKVKDICLLSPDVEQEIIINSKQKMQF